MKLKYKLFLSIFPLAVALLAIPYFLSSRVAVGDRGTRADALFNAAIAGLSELQARQEESTRLTLNFLSQDPAWGEIKAANEAAALNQTLLNFQHRGAIDLLFFAGTDGIVNDAAWAGENWNLEQVRAAVAPIFLHSKKSGFVAFQGHLYFAVTTPLSVNGQSGYLGLASLFPFAGFLHSAVGMESAAAGRDGRWAGTSFALTPDDGQRLSNLGDDQEKISLSGGPFTARTLKLENEGSAPRLALLAPAGALPAAARDESAAVFLFSLLIAVLASTGIAWYLSLSVSAPLELLAKAVADMSAGGIPATAPSSVSERNDEVGAVATSFNLLTASLGNELKQKEKALGKLEKYQSQLLDLNHRLAKKLFENRVMLSLWKEQEKSEDTKDFLSHILEEILQGLPFHYGCIIIRPMAQIGPEVILARIERKRSGKDEISVTDILERSDRTLWLSSLSNELKDFLLKMNQESASSQHLLQDAIHAAIEPDGTVLNLHVVTIRLAQGNQHMGSLHLITEKERFALTASEEEFLGSVASQMSVALDNRSLQYANRVDPLTRLYNRGYMNDRLREEMLRSSRTNRPFTLMLLDIDHFKNVNDTHGHQAGDEILVGLSALLKRSCRASDAICRYGGEEIALILVDTPLPGAKTFAENIRKMIESENFSIPDGKTMRITASMGLAEFPSQAASMQELIKNADDALYRAKREGRNVWRVFPSA